MSRRITDVNVWIVYLAVLILGVGYGVSVALTALFLDAHGFGKSDIGALAACFAAGIVTASLPAGWLVRRVGAKETFVAAALGYAVCVTAFPWAGSFGAVAAVRFFDGACSVLVWVSAETILLARSSRDHKAFVMSLDAISLAIGYVVGPLAARLVVRAAPMRWAFVVSGALAVIAALVAAVALARGLPVAEERAATSAEGAASSSWSILARIKTSCFATFSYGYFQASVVLFLPLFLMERKGIDADRTIVIPAWFAAGMLLFSNVAGRVGDRRGHLAVMRAQAAIGVAMILGFVFLRSYAWMCGAVFVAGATLAAISPVSLALQGIVVAPNEYARANALYNAFYAAGMLVGPPVSSAFYARAGGEAMLLHLAALWTAFVVFTWIFRRDDPHAVAAAPDAAAEEAAAPPRSDQRVVTSTNTSS